MTRDTNEWLHGASSSWYSSRFQLVKKCPEFYGTWKLIATYTRLCFLSPLWARWTHSKPSRLIHFRSGLFSRSHLYLSLPCGLFPSYLSPNSLYEFLFSLHMQLAMPISSLLIWSLIELSSSFPSSLRLCNVVSDTLFSSIITDQAVSPHRLAGTVIKKAIPLQAWAGPEGSRRLRLPDFKTIGTWMW